MALVIKRSDKFPVGTVVNAYAAVGGLNRHHEGKPSGVSLASATVDATGTLTFSTLPSGGLYALNAEVAGAQANMLAGADGWVPPGTLKQRVAARRAAAHV
jgi:hypothetical protein